MNDLISREALKNALEISEKVFNQGLTTALDLIQSASTVDTTCPNCDSGYTQGYSDGYLKGKEERPQGECDCSDCDYFKFSQSFIENVVKFMTDYNIETVEDLMKELNHINELLGGKQ